MHQHHQQKQETLSVIVQPHDDSHDSTQLLSPGKLTPSSEMIDTSDFRTLNEPTYQTLTSVNGRMSPPGFSPNSSYATLTPLQPLPPISTMSDKFAYGHGNNSGPFSAMNNSNVDVHLGLGVNSPYSYDKSPSMDISPPHSYSPLPQSIYSQNGLPSPQKSMSPSGFESPYSNHRDLLSTTVVTTRQNGGNGNESSGNIGSAVSPSSPTNSYSPLRQTVYSQNGLSTRQNGGSANGNIGGQNITITTSAPSPTLSAQSSNSLHSPGGNDTFIVTNNSNFKLNGCLVSTTGVTTGTTITGQNQQNSNNGLQSTPPSLVQIASHHPQQQQSHHQQQQHHHLQHHNQSNIDLLSQQQTPTSSPTPPPSSMLQQQQQQQHHLLKTINNNNSNNSNNNNNSSSKSPQSCGKLSSSAGASAGVTATMSLSSDVEEINTKELAQRISAELKRYSIPQAIFAQRVLCRSQGTLSDLLRNPKPWSKLKSGRETFRRMFKWLQEPEYQRMSALRLAGE